MKIVYAIEDRWGAGLLLKGFHNVTSHQLKIAAYPNDQFLFPIDWNLSSLPESKQSLQKEILKFNPDLFIIDCQLQIAQIAEQLTIPIIYCSPVHLLDGISWSGVKRNSIQRLKNYQRRLKSFPPGLITLIYSDWGNLDQIEFGIKPGYCWITPVLGQEPILYDPKRLLFQRIPKIFRSRQIIDVTTDSLMKIRAMQFIAAPDIFNLESLLNSMLINHIGLGQNLGYLDDLKITVISSILEDLPEISNKKFTFTTKHLTLEEKIEQLWKDI